MLTAAARVVEPELLDDLEPGDPRAGRSRRDLQRVHRAMASLTILQRAIRRLRLAAPPRHILELGAGDGSLMLRLARALGPTWGTVSLTLLDRHDVVSAATREAFHALGWQVTVRQEEVLQWAAARQAQRVDLCVTTLFLHHFDAQTLPALLRAIALNVDAFVACEPRRNLLARVGSELIGLLGANRVTREDAVKSVAAGFRADDLTAAWPTLDAAWVCEEYHALPFTHCFSGVRKSVRRA